MKFESIKILSGTLKSDLGKTTSVIFMPAVAKNPFGQSIVCDSGGAKETYIFISNELIVKSTRSNFA